NVLGATPHAFAATSTDTDRGSSSERAIAARKLERDASRQVPTPAGVLERVRDKFGRVAVATLRDFRDDACEQSDQGSFVAREIGVSGNRAVECRRGGLS